MASLGNEKAELENDTTIECPDCGGKLKYLRTQWNNSGNWNDSYRFECNNCGKKFDENHKSFGTFLQAYNDDDRIEKMKAQKSKELLKKECCHKIFNKINWFCESCYQIMDMERIKQINDCAEKGRYTKEEATALYGQINSASRKRKIKLTLLDGDLSNLERLAIPDGVLATVLPVTTAMPHDNSNPDHVGLPIAPYIGIEEKPVTIAEDLGGRKKKRKRKTKRKPKRKPKRKLKRKLKRKRKTKRKHKRKHKRKTKRKKSKNWTKEAHESFKKRYRT